MPDTDLHPLDRAARRAFRTQCVRSGGYGYYRDLFLLGDRNAQRMFSMARDVPPGIATQMADVIERKANSKPAEQHRAEALRAWAEHCGQRSKRNG